MRRNAGRALVAGLSLAALTAIVALVTGDFDDTEVRVILSSSGFALASVTFGAGAAARLRSAETLRTLGLVTALATLAAYALLLLGLWTSDWGSEGIWRSFGCAALVAVAGAHACIVLGARRASDGEAVRLLTGASLALLILDTLGGFLPISGILEDVDEGAAKLLAATLVLLLLTSVLPPILRRLQPDRPARATADGGFSGEVEAIADRIDELAAGPALRTPEIRREAQRLRELARSFHP